MATTIVFDNKKLTFDKVKNIFSISGKDVRFDTTYEIKNPKTGNSKKFDFKESTGSEWDPKTIWIYKSEDGLILNVGNQEVTPQQEKAYYEHKMRS